VFLVSDEQVPDDSIWVPPNARTEPPWRGALDAVTGTQSIAAATATVITGTKIGPSYIRPGQVYRWTVIGTAAAAGTAANTINIRWGTTGTATDGVIEAFTTAVGTAAASEFQIVCTLTVNAYSSTATPTAEVVISNSAAAGFVNIGTSVLAGTATTFDATAVGSFFSLSITTGASKTLTIKQAFVEVLPARL
jgi:hypothetical protein